MNIKFTIIISLILIGLSNGMNVPQRQRDDADSIIGLIINCEFDKALHISDSLSKDMPDKPLYPILNLMTYGLRNLDFDRAVDTSAFMDSYRKSKEAMEKYKKNNGTTSYGLTLEGFIKASYASYRIYHGKYFSAIGEGLDAVKLLKEANKIDTTNVDSYFFLGFYSYARGELKKKLWMLLFWYPGSRKEGKRMLEECSETAQIASIPSQMILADIYREEKDYKKNEALNASHQSEPGPTIGMRAARHTSGSPTLLRRAFPTIRNARPQRMPAPAAALAAFRASPDTTAESIVAAQPAPKTPTRWRQVSA